MFYSKLPRYITSHPSQFSLAIHPWCNES